MGSYVPTTAAEREEMLAAIGVDSLEGLYKAVPQEMLLRSGGLNIPEGLSELEVREAVTAMAEKNKVFKTVLRGAGAYRHFIPSVVKSVTSREELVTCYTPYQAEISQGVLQGTFEFQTMICELTGMDVSNASHYDGATAAAETIPMCKDRKRTKAYVSACAHPQVIEVMKTMFKGKNGHIAIRTNSVELAVAELAKKGFAYDESSAKYKNGRMTVAYLKDEFGGFAVHLLQK
jgi:glycine dehydrogenase subunit 1